MAVEIRYRPNELGDEGVVEVIPGIDRYRVTDDNTIELLARNGAGKLAVVGHVHPSRWDRIYVYEDSE